MANHGLGGPLSPFEKIEAAYATYVRLDGFKSGCYLEEKSKDLHPLVNITDGNCVEYRDFDFGQKANKLSLSADKLSFGGGSMDIILDDSQNAPCVCIRKPYEKGLDRGQRTGSGRIYHAAGYLYYPSERRSTGS